MANFNTPKTYSLDEFRIETNDLSDYVGDPLLLDTTNSNDITGALIELHAEHGALTSLTTTAKGSFVDSINEVHATKIDLVSGSSQTITSDLDLDGDINFNGTTKTFTFTAGNTLDLTNANLLYPAGGSEGLSITADFVVLGDDSVITNPLPSDAGLIYKRGEYTSGVPYIDARLFWDESELDWFAKTIIGPASAGVGTGQTRRILQENADITVGDASLGILTATGDASILSGVLTVGDGATGEALITLDALTSNTGSIYFSEDGTVRASIQYIGAINSLYFNSGDADTLALTLDSSQNAIFAGDVTMGNLTSTGIDDNASGTAITIDISDNVTFVGGVTATTFSGLLNTAAQTNITSLGNLTFLAVDNIELNGNGISSSIGDIFITPPGANSIVLDGNVYVKDGVITGVVSLTSTTINATGISATNLSGTLQTSTQPNIVSVGTLTSFRSTGIDDNATSTAITIDSLENTVFVGNITAQKGDFIKTTAGASILNVQSQDTYAALQIKGGASTPSYIFFANVNNAERARITVGDNGYLVFGTDGSTTALTLDASQNATFVGGVAAGGSILLENGASGGTFQSKKNDNTTFTLLQLFSDDKVYMDSPIDIRLRTNGATDALTLDASQNATFAGTITSGAVNSNIKLNTRFLNIGAWNMSSNPDFSVVHGLTYSKITTVVATIRNDANSQAHDLGFQDHTETTSNHGIFWDSTSIGLRRGDGGQFDSSSYVTAPGGVRGWVTIQYID